MLWYLEKVNIVSEILDLYVYVCIKIYELESLLSSYFSLYLF